MFDIESNYTGVLQLERPQRFSIVEEPLNNMSDAQLLECYTSSSNEAAFRELVGRYKDGLYSFLRRFLNRQELVEDVFQETFLQLYSSRNRFDSNRPLSPWLFTIATNKAKDAIRKLRQIQEMPMGMIANSQEMSLDDFFNSIAGDNSTPSDKFEKKEIALLVKEVISNMPVNFKEVLLLAYFNKLSYKQIADILNIPEGTVKSRLHSAVGYFAKLWKSLYGNVFIK